MTLSDENIRFLCRLLGMWSVAPFLGATGRRLLRELRAEQRRRLKESPTD